MPGCRKLNILQYAFNHWVRLIALISIPVIKELAIHSNMNDIQWNTTHHEMKIIIQFRKQLPFFFEPIQQKWKNIWLPSMMDLSRNACHNIKQSNSNYHQFDEKLDPRNIGSILMKTKPNFTMQFLKVSENYYLPTVTTWPIYTYHKLNAGCRSNSVLCFVSDDNNLFCSKKTKAKLSKIKKILYNDNNQTANHHTQIVQNNSKVFQIVGALRICWMQQWIISPTHLVLIIVLLAFPIIIIIIIGARTLRLTFYFKNIHAK